MSTRTIVVGALGIAIGAATATLVMSSRKPLEPLRRAGPSALAQRSATRPVGRADVRTGDDRYRAGLEQRVQLLTAKVADEAAKRQRLEEQLNGLTEQLAALHERPGDAAGAHGANAVSAQASADTGAADTDAIDDGKSVMERALVAAGLDASAAAEMKRRHDELTMMEIYLRDQATREGWLNSPRFAEEMAAITDQRTSVRDDIGDDAYDRYLFAQGQSNRVRIDDVMAESVAAQAGLQTGDIVLRYGDARIFGPEDLVNETRSGTAGETIRLEIIRTGQRLQVNVPRGPLGLRIAATQSEPTS